MGYRIQGVLLREKPTGPDLAELERTHGFKLFELRGRELWLLDLALPAAIPGDRVAVRAARPLAPSYVDALRVLGSDDHPFEQALWLTATARLAKLLGQTVLGFVSDDNGLDFAAVATPDGVSAIGDTVEPYLIRWEVGALMIQPYCGGADTDVAMPCVPDELSLIPFVTVLEPERLSGGYPLHGNVVAEVDGFARGARVLGIGSTSFGPLASLRLLDERGMAHSVWDRAAGVTPRQDPVAGTRPS